MIKHQATIGSITAKVDKSLAYRVNTPELTPEEKAMFMELQNQVVEVSINPIDDPEASTIAIKAQKHDLSPSQRLRNVIYALHKQKLEKNAYVESDFETYYRKIMESFIDMTKGQLDE